MSNSAARVAGWWPSWFKESAGTVLSGWLGISDSIGDHLRQFDYDSMVIPVESLSSSERNAEIIRETIMSVDPDGGGPRFVLIGYSKGAPDILTAVVEYPEIRDRVAAVVSVAGAVAGSPVAEKVSQSKLELLRHWPKADCPKGDRGAMESLLPESRRSWLENNPLRATSRSIRWRPAPNRIGFPRC